MTIGLEVDIFELNGILAAMQKHSQILNSMADEYIRTGEYLLKIRDKLILQAKEQGLLTDSFYIYEDDTFNRNWIAEYNKRGKNFDYDRFVSKISQKQKGNAKKEK